MRPGLRERYGPWAVVAGASEGIGLAFAEQLAAAGLDLVLLARREGPLREVCEALAARHGVQALALPLDLARPDLVEALDAGLGGREVGLLVYNACATRIGPLLETPPEALQTMLDVNCRGATLLSLHLGRGMAARGRGGLVIMSSTSGFQGTAMVGVYAATKAYDTALGEALWEELEPQGVHVLVCAAGATSTPNFEQQTPADRRAAAFPMRPEAVAAEALAALGRGRPLVVPGGLNKAVSFVLRRLLSRAGAVRFIGRSTRRIYAAPEPEAEAP